MKLKRSGYRSSLRFYLGMAAVALLSFLLYLGTLQHYFIADDFIFLRQFRFEKPSLFDSFAYFSRDWGMNSLFYRPLIRVVWAAEHALFGENPMGWHLVSVLLYSATTALVYLLTFRLSQTLAVAFLAGLFFSLHPAHSEPVTWIADQTDLFAALFCLAGTIVYIQAQQATYRRLWRSIILNYSLALGCFVLALASKESAIVFFLVPLAYELIHHLFSPLGTWQHKRRNLLRIVLWQIPFWILIALYTKLRLTLLGGMGGYSKNSPINLEVSLTQVAQYIYSYIYGLFTLSLEKAPLNYSVAVAVVLLLSLVLWKTHQVKVRSVGCRKTKNLSLLPVFSISSTALFSLGWIILFILPAIPVGLSSRLIYLATVGMVIFTAALLAPLPTLGNEVPFTPGERRLTRVQKVISIARKKSPINRLKLLLIVGFLVLSVQGVLIEQNFWWQASQITRTTLNQLHELYPDLDNYSRIYVVGLRNRPRPRDSAALVFGFTEAVQLTYDNPTLQGLSVNRFPINERNLDGVYFVEYRDNRLVARNDIITELKTRNSNLKK